MSLRNTWAYPWSRAVGDPVNGDQGDDRSENLRVLLSQGYNVTLKQ
ncbi:hypothetical protein [Deinococcus altitudinis]